MYGPHLFPQVRGSWVVVPPSSSVRTGALPLTLPHLPIPHPPSGPETIAYVDRAYRLVQESGDDQVAFNAALSLSKVRVG